MHRKNIINNRGNGGCFKLSFLIIIPLLFLQTNAQTLDCSKYDCSCSHSFDPFEVLCPSYPNNATISIRAKKSELVRLQCLDNIPWDELTVPDIPVGDVKYFQLNSCFIPKQLSEILDKFQTKKVKVVDIGYAVNTDTVIRRELFQGFDSDSIESLKIVASNVRYIEEGVLKQLVNLRDMDFRDNFLTLTDNMFLNNAKLLDLELSRNRIKLIPEKAFTNLTNLIRLNLWKNELQNITRGTFQYFHALEDLDLSGNKFSTLSADVFSPLKSLTVISLNFNNLTNLPEGLFNSNTLLGEVRITNNNFLTKFPNNLFANFSYLKKLQLLRNKLKELPDNIFRGSINIQNIDLKENDLKTLPKSIFANLTKLQELNLRSNKISFLPETVFDDQKKLRVLHLENNNISTLAKFLFNNLVDLEKLYLQKNRIENIDYVFSRLANLKILDLSHNFITSGNYEMSIPPFPFNSLPKLEEVYLNNNLLTNISDDWYRTKTHLKILNMSNNNIQDFDGFVLQFISDSTVELHLENNKISNIKHLGYLESWAMSNAALDMISGSPPAVKVYLNGNSFNCDCYDYDLSRYFKGLMYEALRAKVVIVPGNAPCAPGEFGGLNIDQVDYTKLTCEISKVAKLSNQPNSAEDCPENCTCMFRPHDKAIIVDCSSNNMTSYPNFTKINFILYNHTELDVSNNQLKDLPEDSDFYRNVTKLYVANNYLEHLHTLPPKIELLELQNNNFKQLSVEELGLLSNLSGSLKNITLSGNPWTCNCETVEFRSFLQDHVTLLMNHKNITCKSSGSPILSLHTEDLCTTVNTLIIWGCIFTAIVAVCGGIAIAVYYRHQHDFKVWLYMNKLTRWLVTEEEVDRDKIYDAFVSYSHKDESFVASLAQILESGPEPYKLCLHGRDWIPGELIPNNIVRSVEDSRRTIIVLSAHFLESMWGILEFRTAHTQAVTEGRARVIVVIYGDVDLENLDEELRNYLKMNTYVKWGDPWFWNKLKYALPHSKVMQRRAQLKKNLMMTLDDKLDLICMPTSVPNASTPPAASLDPLVLKVNPLDFANGNKDGHVTVNV